MEHPERSLRLERPSGRDRKNPVLEGLAYGLVSFLAIDDTSPNHLLVTSWTCFLGYLATCYHIDGKSTKSTLLVELARIGRIIGWTLIVGLAAVSCVGAGQQ